jgi:membrane-anchored protein YejM (alkaline phosphatase superfamily)
MTQDESQEPVGRFAKFTDGVWRPVTDYSAGVPLYTHPPQRTWVGLTDEDDIDWEESGNLRDLVKAIEAKLKEKNT